MNASRAICEAKNVALVWTWIEPLVGEVCSRCVDVDRIISGVKIRAFMCE